MSTESSASFLASKSNYQHILDGTLLPGVSYPETLAKNLTSKRTNHKLAEQGRRNRINNALKEIEALLPPGFAAAKGAKEAESGGLKDADKDKDKSIVSKASTVELAIDYIKALKEELDHVKGKLDSVESQRGQTTTQSQSRTTDGQSQSPGQQVQVAESKDKTGGDVIENGIDKNDDSARLGITGLQSEAVKADPEREPEPVSA